MKQFVVCLGLGLILTLVAADGSAQDYKKLAQSGMEFLNVKADARAMAVGGAATALDMGSGSLFFNPAGMAEMQRPVDLSFSLNEWIADIRHMGITAAVRPLQGKYGVFGVSLQSVDYGDLQWTMVDLGETKGYREIGKFSPSAFAIGVGYARALTDRFSVGGQVHWIRQQLGENILPTEVDSVRVTKKNKAEPVSFDFGTLFKTGFKSLAFGMSVRNFSKEIKFSSEGFQLPLTFTMGISADLLDWIGRSGMEQSLVASVDIAHYRSRPEQVMAGLNYTLFKMLSLRGGYVSTEDEHGFSFGVGLGTAGIAVDYAYTPFGVFDSVQRFTARASF
jgi:hypothetical protein